MAIMLSTEPPIPNHTICSHPPRLVIARRDAVPTRQSSRTMGNGILGPPRIEASPKDLCSRNSIFGKMYDLAIGIVVEHGLAFPIAEEIEPAGFVVAVEVGP
jgi:hypothetical protein